MSKRQKLFASEDAVFHDQVAALHDQQRMMADHIRALRTKLENSCETSKSTQLTQSICDVEAQIRNVIAEECALRSHQLVVDKKANSCWNNQLVLAEVFGFIGDGHPSFQVTML